MREQEKKKKREQEQAKRNEFFAILDTLPIGEFTRYRKVQGLGKDLPGFLDIREEDRRRYFEEYKDELCKGLKQRREDARDIGIKDLLNEDIYRERKKIEAEMRDRGFRMQVYTMIDEFKKFIDQYCPVAQDFVEYIYEQLIIKAKHRKEEEEERALRQRKRLLDDFKYALYDIEPPLSADSKWDANKSRISRLAEYRDVNDPVACQEVFDQVIMRLNERQQRRKSRDRDQYKRSRSPATRHESGMAIDGDTDEHKNKVLKSDAANTGAANSNSSDLEEGEMLA
ncbi:U1 snRNP protein [Coemansia sp. Benny D115]|nr:U1 snRNP protein [Coemansia sp. Benny D115]